MPLIDVVRDMGGGVLVTRYKDFYSLIVTYGKLEKRQQSGAQGHKVGMYFMGLLNVPLRRNTNQGYMKHI